MDKNKKLVLSSQQQIYSYTAKLQIRVRTQVNKLRLTGSYTHSGNNRHW